MSSIRVTQITDTHLSRHHGFFYGNYRRLVDRVNASNPHLVLNTGDLSLDGADRDDDLVFTREELKRITAPLLILPGNHDIGDEPAGDNFKQSIGPERRRRFLSVFGDGERFAIDAGDWRLIGLNSQLMGSGLEAEELQFAWFARQLAAAADRPVGVFLHKPLFIDDPDDAEKEPNCLTLEPRRRMMNAIAGSAVRFVACGHLHQYRAQTWQGIELVWAPSPAFVSSQPKAGAEAVPGWLEWEFSGDNYAFRLVSPDDLRRIDLDEIKGHGKYAFLRDMPPSPPEDWL